MMMVVAMTTDCLSQILDVGELTTVRGVGEVCRELAELVRRCRVAVRLSCFSRALQVRSDLLGDLLILGRVRLLELLKGAEQLGERRKLGAVRLLPDGRRRRAGSLAGVSIGALEGTGQKRLQIAAGNNIVYGTHRLHIADCCSLFRKSLKD